MHTLSNHSLDYIIHNINFDYPIELTNITNINTDEDNYNLLHFTVMCNQVTAKFYSHNNCLWINGNNFFVKFDKFQNDKPKLYQAYQEIKQFLTEALVAPFITNFGFYVQGFKFSIEEQGHHKVLLWYQNNPNPDFKLNLKPVPQYIEVTSTTVEI